MDKNLFNLRLIYEVKNDNSWGYGSDSDVIIPLARRERYIKLPPNIEPEHILQGGEIINLNILPKKYLENENGKLVSVNLVIVDIKKIYNICYQHT